MNCLSGVSLLFGMRRAIGIIWTNLPLTPSQVEWWLLLVKLRRFKACRRAAAAAGCLG